MTTMEGRDPEKDPIRISDRVWWVGHYLPNDPFQCHTYLIENGDRSVLLDPGSRLTFPFTLKKIEKILPFSSIRYFICHHQDPDITAALPDIDRMINRSDAKILSHWRANALLKHLGLDTPLECVEKNGWFLKDGDLDLHFIFTPYLHFPGAFCTYDRSRKILFSSDLFGGFTEEWELFAKDESYFEKMRPFHEHYMPSREILYSGMLRLEQYPMEMIAPQHGSIIPKNLIPYMINRLKGVECGLYLMSQTSTEIIRLSELNKALKGFTRSMLFMREFRDIAKLLSTTISGIISVTKINIYTFVSEEGTILYNAPSAYRGIEYNPPPEIRSLWQRKHRELKTRQRGKTIILVEKKIESLQAEHQIILPHFDVETDTLFGCTLLILEEPLLVDRELQKTLLEIARPLGIALERERILRMMEKEKQRFYEQAIKDPLTGLYTRIYMKEAMERLFHLDDRETQNRLYASILDLDFFKNVNDTYGHLAGDQVLEETAKVLRNKTRGSDIQVRIGGEEFALFMVSPTEKEVIQTLERIRLSISKLDFGPELKNLKITISCGVVKRIKQEGLNALIQRADSVLYQAKEKGRNRIEADFSEV